MAPERALIKEEKEQIKSFDAEGLQRIEKETKLIESVAKALNLDLEALALTSSPTANITPTTYISEILRDIRATLRESALTSTELTRAMTLQ